MNTKDLGLMENVLDYSNRIISLTSKCHNDFSEFTENKTTQEAICFNLIQVAETLNKMSTEYRDEHPEIHFKEIIGLRNKIVHTYGAIDFDIVWDSSINGIPELKQQIGSVLKINEQREIETENKLESKEFSFFKDNEEHRHKR